MEHMLLNSNTIIPSRLNNFSLRGSTLFNNTSYHIVCKPNINNIVEALNILSDIANGRFLREDALRKVRDEVIDEYINLQSEQSYHIYRDLVRTLHLSDNLPIGSLTDIKHISFTNIKEAFMSGYTMDNMCIFITGIPPMLYQKIKPLISHNPIIDCDSTCKFQTLKQDNTYVYQKPISQQGLHYFLSLGKEDVPKVISDLVDSILLSIVEELIVRFTNIGEREIKTDIIQYRKTEIIYRIILNGTISPSTNLLNFLKSIPNSVISEISDICLTAYRCYFDSIDIIESNIFYMNHIANCYIFDEEIYDYEDIRITLNTLSGSYINEKFNCLLNNALEIKYFTDTNCHELLDMS